MEASKETPQAALPEVPTLQSPGPEAPVAPKLRALDLFCGSGSVGRDLAKRGYEVISLDLDPRCHPTVNMNIMEWNFATAFPWDHFDIMAASPPCQEYSSAKTWQMRNLQEADALVERAAGKAVARIFAEDGEARFRALEREVVAARIR